MRTHRFHDVCRFSNYSQSFPEVADYYSQHQEHWRIGDSYLFIDFPQQGSAEETEEDEEHSERA